MDVSERVPPTTKEKEKPRNPLNFLDFTPVTFDDGPFDTRDNTLSLDRKSLQVHHINSVSFERTNFEVTRYRSEKGKLPF